MLPKIISVLIRKRCKCTKLGFVNLQRPVALQNNNNKITIILLKFICKNILITHSAGFCCCAPKAASAYQQEKNSPIPMILQALI